MRALLVALAVFEAFVFGYATPPVQANTAMSRQEIRSLPITERPNRPGHFYGNTVRRRTHRGQ